VPELGVAPVCLESVHTPDTTEPVHASSTDEIRRQRRAAATVIPRRPIDFQRTPISLDSTPIDIESKSIRRSY